MDNQQEYRFTATNPLIEAMHREADKMQVYMGIPANLQDPASLTYRLADLDVYFARLTDMFIQAKAMKESAQNTFLIDNEDRLNKMTATASTRLINAHLSEYKTLYDRLDNMCHLCEHLSRTLVTQISYIKEQMRNLQFDNNN